MIRFLFGICWLTAVWGGELRLRVTDAGGQPMPASGTWNASRFMTTAEGTAVLQANEAGAYRLTVAREGFESRTLLVTLGATENREETVVLAPAALRTSVDVVETTPLPGLLAPVQEIPGPVQTAGASELLLRNALDISSLMNEAMRGVFLNEIQGNPLQPDVNYRGYTASPLLGTPQGLSLYVDGVRLNQPFGDVVSWDLIPRAAIAEMALMPASNPVYGLNTLGGAISIQTKTGLTHRGSALELSGGSFGRKTATLENGGSTASGFHWFGMGHLFFEDGWRESSPSNVRQLFSRVGKQWAKTGISGSFGYANNLLNGNGMQEFRMLEYQYDSVYTKPDITANRAPFVNLMLQHEIASGWQFAGNLYFRRYRTRTYNGDLNDEALSESLYQPGAEERAALAAAGYTGFPTSGANAENTPFPFWRCLGNALLRDEPAEKCNGAINTSRTAQSNYGISGQVTRARGRNEFTAGAAFDRSAVHFGQATQLGYLLPDRSILGVPAFGDGETGGEADGEPFDTRVDLEGTMRTASLFVLDRLRLGRWQGTFAGRYNHTRIDNLDRIRPIAGTGSLTGLHRFQRFNPSVGFTYNAAAGWGWYGNYSEASRAPTSIELGCADPESPCRLPNALAGDPPLAQVVTRSVETGLRGGTERGLQWSAGYFGAVNSNDILFVASPQTGFGYFRNFGRTERQGVELDARGRLGKVALGANYTYLRATFGSPETVNGESNSTNSGALEGEPGMEGTVDIRPGNRIPLMPPHLFKSFAEWEVTRSWSVSGNLIGVGSSWARGNENNLHRPDGVYYLGEGKSDRYWVTTFGTRLALGSRIELFARVQNLFNQKYASAAQLGPAGFDPAGRFVSRPLPPVDGEYPGIHSTFLSPGAPRGVWAGTRIRF